MTTPRIEALDLPAVALALRCSVKTVRREIDRGLLKVFRVGRLLRVRAGELERYQERQTR